MSSFARIVEGFWDAIDAAQTPEERQALEAQLAAFYELHGGPPAGVA